MKTIILILFGLFFISPLYSQQSIVYDFKTGEIFQNGHTIDGAINLEADIPVTIKVQNINTTLYNVTYKDFSDVSLFQDKKSIFANSILEGKLDLSKLKEDQSVEQTAAVNTQKEKAKDNANNVFGFDDTISDTIGNFAESNTTKIIDEFKTKKEKLIKTLEDLNQILSLTDELGNILKSENTSLKEALDRKQKLIYFVFKDKNLDNSDILYNKGLGYITEADKYFIDLEDMYTQNQEILKIFYSNVKKTKDDFDKNENSKKLTAMSNVFNQFNEGTFYSEYKFIPEGDIVKLNINFDIVSGKTASSKSPVPFKFNTTGKFSLNFSSGLFVTNLRNDEFTTKSDSSYGQIITSTDTTLGYTKGYKIIQKDIGDYGFGANILLNVYYKCSSKFNFGFCFGTGILLNETDNLKYLIGGSLIFGSEKRLVLNGGYSFGSKKTLSPKLNEEALYLTNPAIETDTKTSSGYFFGLSYNL